MNSLRVRPASWPSQSDVLLRVREEVFVGEQGVPVELERDDGDSVAFHVLAEDSDGVPVGTGRLLPDGRIGRMCVLAEFRRRGVGSDMLDALLAEARRLSLDQVTLHAQVHAQAFYARHGFVSSGDAFVEAGILHCPMQKRLNPQG